MAEATPQNQVLIGAHHATMLPSRAASPTATPGRGWPAMQRELPAAVLAQHGGRCPEHLQRFGSALESVSHVFMGCTTYSRLNASV
jgi:hypothetical protein